ncbi:Reticulon-like protein B21 [Linum perenne]
MEANGRRRVRPAGVNTRAGSVWESRMKVDDFKGGIKVFNGDVPNDPQSPTSPAVVGGGARRPITRNLAAGTVASSGKRKTWKSESFDGSIQIAGVSVDGVRKSPIQGRKVRSELGISSDGIVKSPAQISKKGRSDGGGGILSSIEATKSRSKEEKELDESVCESEKKESSGSGEISCKEFGVCEEEKVVSTAVEENHGDDDGEEEGEDDDEEEEEGGETEEEIEKKIIDIKEINVEKPKEKVEEEPTNSPEVKPKKAHQFQNRAPPPVASTVRKVPPPVMRRASVYQNFTKPSSGPAPGPSQSRNYPGKHSKLQNLVDLVMWRDVSRSAFVFGIGTFAIISSSYTQDLNISFISVMSYMGLVYLAAIFLGGVTAEEEEEEDKGRYVVGEGEAIGLVKLVLPYLNECLLKIKALFSGDPSTTMKLAVLLFVLARCGGYITIWKLAKLGFFGVFILPKVCSSYSTQLTSCAKFWIRRFRDAWEKCAHKKAVALGIFTLVWNLSSIIARVWAVFMMFVAVRYYQQCMVERDGENWADCDEDEDVTATAAAAVDAGEHRLGPRSRTNSVQVNNSKLKKNY